MAEGPTPVGVQRQLGQPPAAAAAAVSATPLSRPQLAHSDDPHVQRVVEGFAKYRTSHIAVADLDRFLELQGCDATGMTRILKVMRCNEFINAAAPTGAGLR